MTKAAGPDDAKVAPAGGREAPPVHAPPTLREGDVVRIVMPAAHARGDEFSDGTRRWHAWVVVSNPAVLGKSRGILHAVPLTSGVKDSSLDDFFNEHVVLSAADVKAEDDSLQPMDRAALCEHARSIDARRVMAVSPPLRR